MKKNIVKHIESIAVNLPIVMRETFEYHIMTGTEVLEQTEFKEIGGKPINPKLTYKIPMPVQISVNHTNKMKDLYKKYGIDAVKQYSQSLIVAALNEERK